MGSDLESVRHRSPRSLPATEVSQGHGVVEMRIGEISIDFSHAIVPRDRLPIMAEIELGVTGGRHPRGGGGVPRTEAERFPNTLLSFLGAA